MLTAFWNYFFLPSWVTIPQPLQTVMFFQLESGWQYLAKYRRIFGGCGDNQLLLRPQTLPILNCEILSTTDLRRLCCACCDCSYPKCWLHFETCYLRPRILWPFNSFRRGRFYVLVCMRSFLNVVCNDVVHRHCIELVFFFSVWRC